MRFFGFRNKLQPPTSPSPLPTEDPTEHITEIMYKKNAELAERNKTLLLMRRIDEIILSSVTDTKEIAHAVTKMLVSEADFKIAAIYTIQPTNVLRRLSLYEEKSTYMLRNESQKMIYEVEDIPLSFEENALVTCVHTKQIAVTGNLYDILVNVPARITQSDANEIQKTAEINTTFIYPLIARDEVIGVMTISLQVKNEDLSDHQKDLLSRLYDIIGIAVDNAILYNKVQESNEKLKALDKMKDEFVSLASHELRTPMTAIKSYLWMALNKHDSALSEKQTRYLTIAYNSTERLIALVNDMLNVSRIESGRITLEKTPGSIDKVAQAVIDEVMPRTQELHITMDIADHRALPLVLIDQNKMKEVIMNLVGNSLKFTPAGGRITLSFEPQDGVVQTEVADTGKGILPEDMPKLFEKFGLIEGSYAQNQVSEGTGLGLYITKSIIQMHGGKIWVESDGRDKGTRIFFTLPIVPNNLQVQEAAIASTKDTSSLHSPSLRA